MQSPEGTYKHSCKHHAEQCRSKHITLFHAVCHWKSIRYFSIVKYVCHHAIVELSDYRNELSRQPNFAMILQRPSRLTVSKALVKSMKVMESLGQVNEDDGKTFCCF